jgi:hypothetical protein
VAADFSKYLDDTDVRPIGSARPFFRLHVHERLTATLVAALAKGGGVIAMHGKSLKGSCDKGKSFAPKMMVSAFATGSRSPP